MKQIHFETINSTNKYIKEHYDELDDLTFVSASFQYEGRGRYDRKWIAKKGENLLFSFLIKDKSVINNYKYLSLGIAVALLNVFKKHSIKSKIKWPNDVYINSKKVGGILLEGSIPNYLICGCGINVNQSSFSGEYKTIPTSLYIESKTSFNLDTLKEEIYNEILLIIDCIKRNDFSFVNIAKNNDFLKDKTYEIVNNKISKKVIVIGIDNDCSLKVIDDNKVINIISGEI